MIAPANCLTPSIPAWLLAISPGNAPMIFPTLPPLAPPSAPAAPPALPGLFKMSLPRSSRLPCAKEAAAKAEKAGETVKVGAEELKAAGFQMLWGALTSKP